MCHLVLFLPVFALPLFWLLPASIAFPLYFFILAISLLIYFKVFQAMRAPVWTGREGMLGKEGLVVKDIDPEGKIKYASEIWHAVTRGRRLSEGERVRICGFAGLRLVVEETPAEDVRKGSSHEKS